jgi:hypothetical protein
MPNYKIARLIKLKEHFRCEICESTKLAKVYEYQSISFVVGYIPNDLKYMLKSTNQSCLKN